MSTHDVIGKPLRSFYRSKKVDSDDEGMQIQVPYVFIKIYEYFLRDETRLKNPKELFKK